MDGDDLEQSDTSLRTRLAQAAGEDKNMLQVVPLVGQSSQSNSIELESTLSESTVSHVTISLGHVTISLSRSCDHYP